MQKLLRDFSMRERKETFQLQNNFFFDSLINIASRRRYFLDPQELKISISYTPDDRQGQLLAKFNTVLQSTA